MLILKMILNDAFIIIIIIYSLVKELRFSVVVFDTAPTGHTLRFLSMPQMFEKGVAKIGQIKSSFGPIMNQVVNTYYYYYYYIIIIIIL